MPRSVKKNDMMMKYWDGCCGSKMGITHLVLGVGVGLLVVHYFALTDLLLWGWILVGLGLLGHLFMKKM